MSLGTTMRTLESFLDSLPGQIEERVNWFVSALRSAIYDISHFVKIVVLSLLRIVWEVRKLAYIIVGFVVLFCFGVELAWSDFGTVAEFGGWLLIAIDAVILVVFGLRLATLPWRSPEPPTQNSARSRRVPLMFFILVVIAPILYIVLTTVLSDVKFWFFPLRFAQQEVERGIGVARQQLGWTRGANVAPLQTPPRLVIEGVENKEKYTVLHLAALTDTNQGYAKLRPATGAYIVDKDGNRYALRRDLGQYARDGSRDLRNGETYRFDLLFERFHSEANFFTLVYPQFGNISFAWSAQK